MCYRTSQDSQQVEGSYPHKIQSNYLQKEQEIQGTLSHIIGCEDFYKKHNTEDSKDIKTDTFLLFYLPITYQDIFFGTFCQPYLRNSKELMGSVML